MAKRSSEAGHSVHELLQTPEEQDLHSHFPTSLPESVNSYSTPPDLIHQIMVNIMYAKEKKQTGILSSVVVFCCK